MTDRRWVAADPFRAHLHHVCAETALPWQVVALSAGLPLGLARDLLDVRPGRRVARIAPELARQVLGIRASEVIDLRSRVVPGRPSSILARRLLDAGWTSAALAGRLRMARAEVDALAFGQTPHVTSLVQLRLTVLAAARPFTSDTQWAA